MCGLDINKVILTVQNCSLCHHLLNVILSLREYEEDACNASFHEFCQIPVLVQDTAQDE